MSFFPADHSRGDANTIGGYALVHARPAAFEGPDGMSYSVEVEVDALEQDEGGGFGGYLLFVRWRRYGAPGVDGHVETEYLARGNTVDEARAATGALPLSEARAHLERLVANHQRESGAPARRWWGAIAGGDAP